MSNYETHAMNEFRAAGWIDETDNYTDDMQKMICEHVLKLLYVFDGEGHSGSSAPYAINMFEKLAKFEPLVPLTGEDWEWVDVAEQSGGVLYQNKRCSHVFKDPNGAYDIQGKVFYDWYTNEDGKKSKSYYTCGDSRVYVTFPYTPYTEYVEGVSE